MTKEKDLDMQYAHENLKKVILKNYKPDESKEDNKNLILIIGNQEKQIGIYKRLHEINNNLIKLESISKWLFLMAGILLGLLGGILMLM